MAGRETTAWLLSRRRWCIREDDSLGSPFGPLLKQRYPPWRWRLSRRPWNNSVAAISEKMVHPGGFEPPTARFVAEYSIQLSYGCIGKLALLPILIPLLKPYQVRDGASGRIRTSDRSVRSRVLYPAELRMHRETCFTADIDTAAKAISSKRWCIREDDSLGSPFGPLLKQRYPPWCWRLSRRP